MKTSLKSLLAVAAVSASALLVQAQTATKIAVVDVAKIFDGHYKTAEQNEKLKGFQQKAQEEIERMGKELQGLQDKFKETVEQAKNPVLTAEARAAAEKDAQRQGEEGNKKLQEFQNYQQNAQRTLQGTQKAFVQMLVDEIFKLSTEIAKKKGIQLLIDKSSVGATGVPSLVYSDASLEITDEVVAEINKTRPVSAIAPAAAPAAAPAKSGDAPAVSFPGTKK